MLHHLFSPGAHLLVCLLPPVFRGRILIWARRRMVTGSDMRGPDQSAPSDPIKHTQTLLSSLQNPHRLLHLLSLFLHPSMQRAHVEA